jgi:hypothetical protein
MVLLDFELQGAVENAHVDIHDQYGESLITSRLAAFSAATGRR